jgi:hypothetical protein
VSAKATFWAWRQTIKPASAKLILLCLADCHNGDNGQCNPSVQYLAKTTGLDRKTVMSGIASLEEMGAIEVFKQSGLSTNYNIATGTEIGSTGNGTGTESGSADIPPKQYRKRDKGSTENGTRTYKESKKNLGTRFKPPTLDEVATYCDGRSSPVDPEHFYDSHMACGWKLANGNQIKDWMAVVRTWERNARRWAVQRVDDTGEEHIL